MKLSNILTFPDVITDLSAQKLPFTLVYKFARLNEAVKKEIGFYQEQLRKIISDCAELDENGEPIEVQKDDGAPGGIKIRADAIDECNQRFEELQNLEIELPVSFKSEELEKLELTLEQMTVLMPLISE